MKCSANCLAATGSKVEFFEFLGFLETNQHATVRRFTKVRKRRCFYLTTCFYPDILLLKDSGSTEEIILAVRQETLPRRSCMLERGGPVRVEREACSRADAGWGHRRLCAGCTRVAAMAALRAGDRAAARVPACGGRRRGEGRGERREREYRKDEGTCSRSFPRPADAPFGGASG